MTQQAPAPRTGRRVPFTARQIAGLVLLVLGVVFALQNRTSTRIRFLIPEVTAPLWVALVLALLVGILIGGLLSWRRR